MKNTNPKYERKLIFWNRCVNAIIKNFEEEKFSRNRRKRKIGKFHGATSCNHARGRFDFGKYLIYKRTSKALERGGEGIYVFNFLFVMMQKSFNRIYIWNKHNYYDWFKGAIYIDSTLFSRIQRVRSSYSLFMVRRDRPIVEPLLRPSPHCVTFIALICLRK